MPDVPRLEFAIDARASEIGSTVLEVCRREPLLVVETQADQASERVWWDLALGEGAHRIPIDEDSAEGHPTGNLWSDVRFDPRHPDRFRHSSAAQPLHTDGAYIREPPDIVFMVCHRAAPDGGATLFVSARDLLATLEACEPRLLCALRTTPMVFEKGGSRIESTVIFSYRGELCLRWNFYALSPCLSTPQRRLAGEFQEFLSSSALEMVVRRILLKQGQAVFFRDAQFLHGREAFAARVAGERHLWKGGLAL